MDRVDQDSADCRRQCHRGCKSPFSTIHDGRELIELTFHTIEPTLGSLIMRLLLLPQTTYLFFNDCDADCILLLTRHASTAPAKAGVCLIISYTSVIVASLTQMPAGIATVTGIYDD